MLLTSNKSAVHSSSVFCILVSWAQLSLLKFSLLLLAALLSADCEAICKSHRYRHRSESLDNCCCSYVSSYFGYSAKTAPRHANEKCLGKTGKKSPLLRCTFSSSPRSQFLKYDGIFPCKLIAFESPLCRGQKLLWSFADIRNPRWPR